MPRRLTRKEKQAHTRSCLMKSAAKVFARRGLQQASIDEVAEDAGYTKGAFYANFKSKEELFLAMLDERFAKKLEQIEQLAESDGDLDDQVRRVANDYTETMSADPEWQRLFFEFSAYAARNEDFRQELVTRYRALRERISDVFGRVADQAGVEPPIPTDEVAVMTFAMANGIALEKLLEPETVSDDAYGTMLSIFFRGLAAMAEDSAVTR